MKLIMHRRDPLKHPTALISWFAIAAAALAALFFL
jgi:hypothetical protein